MINSQVYIRKPIPEDLEFMLQLENDQDLWKVSQTTKAFTEDEIANFILNNKHNLTEELQLRLMIILKEEDRPIGTLDLYDYDKKGKSAGVGISILKGLRAKGYASKVMPLFINYAFTELALKELFCTIFIDNQASIALFESQGFEREELLKNYIHYQGNDYDVYLYRLKQIDFYE